MHVVSVGSPEEQEFGNIKTGFYNALKLAEQSGIKKIVAPAMGTGIIGQLTDEQSAKAMMSAVAAYEKDGGKPLDVSFVIYADPQAYKTFGDVLTSKSYEAAKPEVGKREFDAAGWTAGMQRDLDANRKAFSDVHTKRDPLNPDGSAKGK